jgi:hypothetical protein
MGIEAGKRIKKKGSSPPATDRQSGETQNSK